MKFKRYIRWVINAQHYLLILLFVIAINIFAYGRNLTDKIGCLIAHISRTVCHLTGACIAFEAVLSFLQSCISKLDNIVEEANDQSPYQI
ncbi:hypothetical protein Plhal304r1_c013g0049231 [Plasmopara halstedii]